MTERQITNRINKLQALEAQQAELEKQITELKKEIQAEMHDSEVLNVGSFIVKWATIVTNRLNTTAIKTELPDLYNKYITQSISKRFTITTNH